MYRILELNPQLQYFSRDIDLRMQLYRDTKARLLGEGQTLNDFANAHNYYGIHHLENGWVYREWAPSAYQLYLTGDFNGWNQTSHPLKSLGNGNWEIYLDENQLWEGCKVKTVVDANMTRTEHIPLYARRVVQDPKTITFCCEVVDDRKAFDWTDADFQGENSLFIYEAHVGMAQEEGKVGSYREFADLVLPASRRRVTIPSSSWPSWSTPTTAASAIRSPTSLPPPAGSAGPKTSNIWSTKPTAWASGCCWMWCTPTR